MVTTNNNVLSKILKRPSRVSASVLHKLFSELIESTWFPQKLNLADITSVHKKIVFKKTIDLLVSCP